MVVTDYDTNYCHVICVTGVPGESSKRDSITEMVNKGDSAKFSFQFYAPSGVSFAALDTKIVIADTFEQRILMFDAVRSQQGVILIASCPQQLIRLFFFCESSPALSTFHLQDDTGYTGAG